MKIIWAHLSFKCHFVHFYPCSLMLHHKHGCCPWQVILVTTLIKRKTLSLIRELNAMICFNFQLNIINRTRGISMNQLNSGPNYYLSDLAWLTISSPVFQRFKVTKLIEVVLYSTEGDLSFEMNGSRGSNTSFPVM
jgi:hypothetical protein